MAGTAGLYLITAIIVGLALAGSFVLERLLNGQWPTLERMWPIIVLYAAMAVFIPYRRSRGLDLTPPWLTIGVGVIGIAAYSFIGLTKDVRPGTPLEWMAVALLVAMPVGLLIHGVRRLRRLRGAGTN